ncbi:hypothetical protein, partial [Paraburkholderia kururiensis]|uniref:hypothetical protein n=1 Tax=Paraburkholderia kururiensis TaxID=984307 RepID=UPI001E3D8C12
MIFLLCDFKNERDARAPRVVFRLLRFAARCDLRTVENPPSARRLGLGWRLSFFSALSLRAFRSCGHRRNHAFGIRRIGLAEMLDLAV